MSDIDEFKKHTKEEFGIDVELVDSDKPTKFEDIFPKEDIKMDYEEKRELRKQISQLLADAGLNQAKIKEIVEEEIHNKIDRAIDQTLKNLNAQSGSGSYITDRARAYFRDPDLNYRIIEAIKSELRDRVINITLKDTTIDKD